MPSLALSTDNSPLQYPLLRRFAQSSSLTRRLLVLMREGLGGWPVVAYAFVPAVPAQMFGAKTRRCRAAVRRLGTGEGRMVRILELHESAMVPCCSPVLAIMGFEDPESPRPIPIPADRCLRLDESAPTAGPLITFARRIAFFESNSAAGEYASMTTSDADWPLEPKPWGGRFWLRSPPSSRRRPCWPGTGN
jgi:hypothetical protein